MKYQKIILVLVIVLAAVWGIKFFKRQKIDNPIVRTVPPEQPNTGLVQPEVSEFFVTAEGAGEFNPRHIRIKMGDKVTWLNKGSVVIWPAVGPHPTHDIYPEFDSKHGIKSGENWSFTFQRLGMWQYHNHLKGGSMVGIVEVLAE